ncbi:DUF1758 domain-containing protein [Trichonephila clavipes]|nr:DUF1758 domain-containing protein [Trichonephila clavipes]
MEVIHTRNSDSTEIKLPTLSLPFSGVIDEWLTFSDLFQAAVTNHQNLTGAQKLQYLKGVLKGDAQKIVQSLPITDDSTTRVWWERSLDNEKIPSLSELLQFLSNHARSLMTEGYGVKRNISNKKVTLVASSFQLHCSYCQSNHNLNKCDAFQNLTVRKKSEFCKIE